MRRLASPLFHMAIALAVIFGLYALLPSPNNWLLAICLSAIPAIIFLAGGRNATPVLIFILGLSWMQIAAIVVLADLYQVPVTQLQSVSRILGSTIYIEDAIAYGLYGLLVLAAGMRFGEFAGRKIFRKGRAQGPFSESSFEVTNLVLGYCAALLVAAGAEILARAHPALTQFLIPFTLIKFVFIYLIAAVVIERRRGFGWLALIALFEVTSGAFAFFAQFKEAIFVIAVAVIAARRKLNLRLWLFIGTAVAGIVWMLMIWSVVKQEFRRDVVNEDFHQKAEFLAENYTRSDRNYTDALKALLERIQYTSLFGRIIQMERAGELPQTTYYDGAIKHVLTPRILFPDKMVLDDTKKTVDLTGLRIAENTSVGIGYFAEAFADYRFPGMLVPVLMIGTLLGFAARYFMSRPVPRLMREGFATATLFLSFEYAANIDKNLGGFVTQTIAMAIIFKFGYPLIAPRLRRRRRCIVPNPFGWTGDPVKPG